MPAEVRRKLGVAPGSVLQWDEEGADVVVRRSGRYSSEDVHRALFPRRPARPRTLSDLDAGARRHAEARYERR